MRIALAQTNPTIGDFDRNMAKMKDIIDKTKSRNCDLVVFPELAVMGYPPKDLLEKAGFIEDNLQVIKGLIKDSKGIGVICGFVDRNTSSVGKPLYNSALLFYNGHILLKVHKRLLPCYDVFDETRYFEPGPPTSSIAYNGKDMGLTICEDIWNDKDFFERRLYSADPVEELVKGGAEILVNISASPYHIGKRNIRWEILKNIATKYKVLVIFVNQVGANDDLLFDGNSLAIGPDGRIVAMAKEFEEDVVILDTQTQKGETHPITQTDSESILKALVMGTRDYVTKCGFKKVVVGLSGGVDSSLVAYIATEALGNENVLGVAMPSPYTSKESMEDAAKLSKNLGIPLEIIPISKIFQAYLKELSSVFKGRAEDVTEENIQARIRGNILMALSNKFGYLVLSTGNKSELATGYCTLYGDMSGGLAVISDVPKTMVYELARYVNREGEIIPQRVLEKPPSAELRPGQLDQDTLPPYEVLDGILREYIEHSKSPSEIIREGYDPEIVREVIKKVERNEYKRKQAAPGLKITTKAFGYGRRYPIAQGYRGL
ncbi:MAG TPA: NAD+ synthase [Syntrophaceae bacterium]|nr:NAD+ synthase [Syntrophaceae bacterium]